MKTLFIFTVALVFAALSGTALADAPEEKWNRTYGGARAEWAYSFQQTSDGGYIVLGTVSNISYAVQYPADIFVVKTDPNGKEQWSRTFGEKDDDRALYIMQTRDSGYIIAWSAENYSAGSSKIWLMKLDGDGKEIWKKDFGAPRQYFGGNYILEDYNEIERSIRETPDGGFLVLGKTDTCENCSRDSWHPMDIWLMKIDPNGNEEWKRTLGRTDKEGYSIAVTPDGGFILAGTSSSNMTWLEKSDRNGNSQWNRTYEGLGGTAVAIHESSDGYAAAIANTENNSGWRIWIMKTDTNGSMMWQRSSREADVFDLFLQTVDGGYLLGVNDWENGQLLKMDSGGNELWKKTITGISITSLQQTRDGGYLLGGNQRFSSDSFGGYMIARIDLRGNQQWTRIFENNVLISGSLFRWAKTAVETEDGYVIVGSYSPGDTVSDIKLVKLKKETALPATFTHQPEYPGINQTVTFETPFVFNPNHPLLFVWSFGDRSGAEGILLTNITHSYAQEGIMTVELLVVDNNSTVGSAKENVTIRKSVSPEEIWNLTFGEYTGARYADETEDGFIIAGESMSEGVAYSWLLRTDASGEKKWNKSFRGRGMTSVAKTPDGGTIITGNTLPSGDIWAAKIDPDGNERWSSKFSGQGFDQAGAVSPIADGGFIIAGSYASSNNEHSDAWLVKIDSNGTKQWDRRFTGGAGRNLAMGARQTVDGGYIAAGTMAGVDFSRAWLIKIDPKGNEEWTRTFGTGGLDWGGSVMQAADGGFLISGTSMYTSYPSTYTDLWLLKTDPEGNEQWKKSFFRVNGNAWADPLSSTPDGSYLFSAVVQEHPGGYEHDEVFYTMTVKTDPDGNLLWQKKESGFGSIRQTSEGGYVTVREDRLVGLSEARLEQRPTVPVESEKQAEVPKSGAPGWVLAAGVLAAAYLGLRREE